MVGVYEVGRWGWTGRPGLQERINRRLNIHVISDGITRLPVLEGEICHIEIPRGQSALGLTIVGGADTPLRCVVVQEVFPDGVVAQDGRLQPGDQIIEVNGVDMTSATHHQVCQALRHGTGVLRLGVYRERIEAYRAASPQSVVSMQGSNVSMGGGFGGPFAAGETISVTLTKETGRQLGIKLGGRRTEPGIFIMEVLDASVASLDGRLHAHDRILAINGADVRYARLDHASRLIQQSSAHVTLVVSRGGGDAAVASSVGAHNTVQQPYPAYESGNPSGSPWWQRAEVDANSAWRHMDTPPSNRSQSFDYLTEARSLPSSASSSPAIDGLLTPSSSSSSPSSLRHGESRGPSPEMEVPVPMIVTQGVPLGHCRSGEVEGSLASRTTGAMAPARQDGVADTNNALLTEYNRRRWRAVQVASDHHLQQKNATLSKNPHESLGMRIGGGVASNEGDTPIYIANINPQGPVGRAKQVKKGDVLLSVNGQSLLGLTHGQAVALLKATAELGGVTLSVLEGPETCVGACNFVPSWLYWQKLPRSLHISKSVVLHRAPGASLGFSIVGGSDPQRGPEPIHVLFVVQSSPAALDGKLRCGDRLLAVDGHSLESVRHSSAVNLLKQAGHRVHLEVVSWLGTEM
ncbi:ligand of Numb protein X 2-like [Oratosquilla oratoria]|uniref:ligand of Numb protein X 2-like n=1 Tax=Oratosquilla oratoria TaxID=337810 RepID=UPI003F759EE5